MAKKIKKIIITEPYFNLLVQKSDFLDSLTTDGELSIAPSHFKDLEKIGKAVTKVDSSEEDLYATEPYDPPKPVKD
jgi:hypothetical protein